MSHPSELPLSDPTSDRVPAEVWAKIITNLDTITFPSSLLVCKLWSSIIDSPKFSKRKLGAIRSFLTSRFQSCREKSPFCTKFLAKAIRQILTFSQLSKRAFLETVELQVNIKNYDPNVERRFVGSTLLPFPTKKSINVVVIGTPKHCDEARSLRVDCYSPEEITSWKKDKKIIKKKFQQCDYTFASESLIRTIPRMMGPQLNKMAKFPHLLTDQQTLKEQIDMKLRTVKIQMKRENTLGFAVGHAELTEDQLLQNITTTINFLISLVPGLWGNIASLHIKTTMGPGLQIWPFDPPTPPTPTPKALHPPCLISSILPELIPSIDRYYCPRAVTPKDEVTVLAPMTNGGVCISNDGTIYFTEKNNLYKIDSETKLPFRHYRFRGDGGSAFDDCGSLFVTKEGNIMILDTQDSKIRSLTPQLEVIEIGGEDGDEVGPVATARFNLPTDVCYDDEGNLLVCDNTNRKIKKITPDGIVSTIAGDGTTGDRDGEALKAQFEDPFGICHRSGVTYIVDVKALRKLVDGKVSVFSPVEGTFICPDYQGNFIISDEEQSQIKMVYPDGSCDVLLSTEKPPCGISIDAHGDVYWAEDEGQLKKISTGITTRPSDSFNEILQTTIPKENKTQNL